MTTLGEAMAAPDIVRWWWVRHAPVAAQGFCGWTDAPADLSDDYSLAALRAALPEDAVLFTSDLERAIATAEVLARRTWRRQPAEPALREQNFGEWEGRSYGEDGPDLTAFWRDPANTRPPEGESFADLCERVGRFVASATEQDSADVVVVAHAGVVRAALALALGLPPVQALAFEVSPLSLTRIDWVLSARAWRIGAVNISV